MGRGAEPGEAFRTILVWDRISKFRICTSPSPPTLHPLPWPWLGLVLTQSGGWKPGGGRGACTPEHGVAGPCACRRAACRARRSIFCNFDLGSNLKFSDLHIGYRAHPLHYCVVMHIASVQIHSSGAVFIEKVRKITLRTPRLGKRSRRTRQQLPRWSPGTPGGPARSQETSDLKNRNFHEFQANRGDVHFRCSDIYKSAWSDRPPHIKASIDIDLCFFLRQSTLNFLTGIEGIE